MTALPQLDPAARDRLIIDARKKVILDDFAFFCQYVVTEEGPLPDWEYLTAEVIPTVNARKSFIWLKRRQVLASWVMAAALAWISLHPSWHSGVSSKDEDETREIVRRTQFILRNLPSWLRPKWVGSDPIRVKHENGRESIIQPYAATAAAGVGRAFKFFLFDEFAFHPYGKENLSAVLPAIQNSGGMVAITSTSDPKLSQAGAMYDTWLAATEGRSNFTPIFTGRFCRPDQDAAILDLFRQDSPDDDTFTAFYPEKWQDAFTARTGLVFGKDKDGEHIFDKDRNMRKPEVAWKNCLWRIVGIDPGGNDPSAVVPVGVWKPTGFLHPYTDRYHAYGSYQSREPMSVGDLEDILKEINAKGPIHIIFIDPSQRMVGETLRDRGWPVEMANNDRSMVFYLRDLFKRGQLTFNPDDDGMLDELLTTEWKRSSGEFSVSSGSRRLLFKTPQRHHADRLDALRYAIAGVRDFYPKERAGESIPAGLLLRGSQVLTRGSGVLTH